MAMTNKQLRFIFERIKEPCVYIKSHRSFFNGVKKEAKGVAPYISIMTLNEAKGKTLRNVFIVGVDERLLPHSLSTNIEEEKHLFYVGMSRPKGDLFISYQEEPSRFLRNLRCYRK